VAKLLALTPLLQRALRKTLTLVSGAQLEQQHLQRDAVFSPLASRFHPLL